MMKVGKYEKMRKRALMRTYITSLVCLALCVTMFLGTTMAWFSDTVASPQNQMYVGTLEIDLHHATFSNGDIVNGTNEYGGYSEVDGDYKVLKDTIKWEPGYTAVEKFRLTENGDLAFGYLMNIDREFAEAEKAQIAIAQNITVWNYVGDKPEDVTTLPENFSVMSGSTDWEKVGTLYEVITNKLPVFKGSMDKTTVTATEQKDGQTVADPGVAYHIIALHMNEGYNGIYQEKTANTAELSVQGQRLDNITISVVATQLPSETDAFGSNYDNYVEVADAEELQEALNNAQNGNIIQFTNNITATEPIVVNQPQNDNLTVTIDGKGYTFDGQMKIKGNSENTSDDSLTIKNINFVTSTNDHDFIWSADTQNGSVWRYAHNVTIDNCTFTATSGSAAEHTAVGIRFQQAYNITVKNCTATNMHSLLQAESCATTVTVDGCKVIKCKNGVSLNNTQNAVVKNCEIESVVEGGYGIRHKGAEPGYALTVENCTVKAFVPVLIRNMTGTGYTATFTGTNTLTATNPNGYQIVLSKGDWDGTQTLEKPTGSYTLTGAESFTVFQ